MSALTSRQRAFVSEYLVDLNARRAAKRAGYSGRSAYSYGPRLLMNDSVAKAIRLAMQERRERLKISQDLVLEELAKVAFGDLRELMAWGPEGVRFKDSRELNDAQVALVCEVAEGTGKSASGGGALRIKRHDKLKALELLGKHLGMFKENQGKIKEGSGIIREFMEALREDAAAPPENGPDDRHDEEAAR